MTIPKPHFSNPNQKSKITKSSLPVVVTEVVGLSLPNVSLDIWHTNLDSNPNPNKSTNANSLFHGCGTPKLVSVAPSRSLQ